MHTLMGPAKKIDQHSRQRAILSELVGGGGSGGRGAFMHGRSLQTIDSRIPCKARTEHVELSRTRQTGDHHERWSFDSATALTPWRHEHSNTLLVSSIATV